MMKNDIIDLSTITQNNFNEVISSYQASNKLMTEGKFINTDKINPQLNFTGLIFARMDISGWDLSDRDLSDTTFITCDLYDTKFTDAKLKNSSFAFCDLVQVGFRGANADSISFFRTNLRQADFTTVYFSDAYFDEVTANDIVLSGKIEFSAFHDCEFRKLNAAHLKLDNVEIVDSNLSYGIFKDSAFRQSNFINVRFMEADFSHAKITNSIIKNCNFSTANMRMFNIHSTHLLDTKLDAPIFQYGPIGDELKGSVTYNLNNNLISAPGMLPMSLQQFKKQCEYSDLRFTQKNLYRNIISTFEEAEKDYHRERRDVEKGQAR